MKMTVPKYLEDCAGYFDDFYNFQRTGHFDLAEDDGEAQQLYSQIEALSDRLSTACKRYFERVDELNAQPITDDNSEHRLSMQQLGISPGRT